MDDREMNCMLGRIEALAKANQQLGDNLAFHLKRADGLQRTADEVERLRCNLDSVTTERKNAYARVAEWEKYGTALRESVPLPKRLGLPKMPEPFDDIPF